MSQSTSNISKGGKKLRNALVLITKLIHNDRNCRKKSTKDGHKTHRIKHRVKNTDGIDGKSGVPKMIKLY